MKRLLILPLFLIIPLISSAEYIEIKDSDSPFTAEIIESTLDRTVIKYAVNGYHTQVIPIEGENYTEFLKSRKESLIMEKGYPQLPRINRSLIIPDEGIMGYKIILADYIEIDNIDIAPSKGYLLRSLDPETVPYEFADCYEKDEFFPSELVTLRKPYILRDYRGMVVELNAFQYNPVQKTLRIYTDITIEVTRQSPGGINTFDRITPLTKIDPQFDKMYRSRFENYELLDYPSLLESGCMLIICYDNFMDEMTEFVDWKIQKGIPVEMVPASEAGSTPEAIKAFISDYYRFNDLTYVLLVGDAAQIPTFSDQLDSDPIYSLLAGNDSYPEIFIGRFSAETLDEVITQVQRTVNYEKYPDPTLQWYEKGLVIGSTEGPFPSHYNEYDYTHMTKIAYKLLDYTYTQVDSAYDYWCTMEATIDIINEGRSILFYAGHGGPEGWGTSGISTAEVSHLENTNMLPHINSVACNTGQFMEYTCLGEAWLRATNDITGEPTGGIGFYGSVEGMTGPCPLDMQDECIDLLVADSMLTYGGICFNGSMLMIDLNGATGEWEFKNLTVFGDPSVSLRGRIPFELSISHNPELLIGTSSMQITATCFSGPVKGLNVCAMNDEVYASAITNASGQVVLNFDNPIQTIQPVLLTVSGGDAIPSEIDIPVIDPASAYVIYAGYQIEDDITGNGNGQLEFYETVDLTMSFVNNGINPATGCWGIISTQNQYATINTDSVWMGDMLPADSLTIERAFQFSLSPGMRNNDPLIFNLSVQDGINVWDSQFSVPVHAPVIAFADLLVDDSFGGNGDSVLAAGETADLLVTLVNEGSYVGENIIGVLTCNNPLITVLSNSAQFGNIDPGRITEAAFNVSAAPEFYPPGSVVEFNLNISGDHEYTDETGFIIPVGDIIAAPTGPDTYGYSGYDRNDYPFFTTYDWVEISADSGGPGHRIPFTLLDEVYHLALPFEFQYYGINYDRITVNTKGQICMGTNDVIDYTASPIPDPDGPPAMICPVWGDLDPAGATVAGAGGVWQYYNANQHLFIIEFNQVPWYIGVGDEWSTFEIILFDPLYYQTTTGDGRIKMQFKEFQDWGPTGIENHTQDDGVQYRYGENYPATSALLENETAVIFSTPMEMPELVFTLTPAQLPIIIPPGGGSFDYEVQIENNGASLVVYDAWMDVILPNGVLFGPLLLRQGLTLESGGTLSRNMTQYVPGGAPEGIYTYQGKSGAYSGMIYSMDSFSFEKTGAGESSGEENWTLYGWEEGMNIAFSEIPTEYNLKQNYPNPFNPATTIRFDLPQAGWVTLDIFDITGRSVGVQNFEPLHQWMSAGSHSITFDGSDLASGIYFARLQAGEYVKTMKLLLLK